MKQHFSIRVLGKVQGVGFRYHTRQKAISLQIYGQVKNHYDGSVLIKAEGEEENLKLFLDWCKKGPDWARVDQILINEEPVENVNDFVIC
jgi:acylphosphatase